MKLQELIEGLNEILEEKGDLDILTTKISLEIQQEKELVNFNLDKSGMFKKTYSLISYISGESEG